jgi:spermidine dehydrogenase
MTAPKITRRDFLNGIAISVAAGSALSPLEILAADGRYPPALTGMRGSHPGSFEIAHALAWGNLKWPRPDAQTDETYDLVVVGGGISGLSAASMFRRRRAGDSRILILDNHDDFGGHAKRNEFTVGGELLVGYGGSQSIQGPKSYSAAAFQFLKDVGVVTDRFYEYFDQQYFKDRNLERGLYFKRDAYGADITRKDVMRGFGGDAPAGIATIVEGYPIPPDARRSLVEVLGGSKDYLAGTPAADRAAQLRSMSYSDYLRKHARAHEEVVTLLRDRGVGWWGVGYDAVSALSAQRAGMPGFAGMTSPDASDEDSEAPEPYIFHFPDGNAGIARLIVRSLIPGAVAGHTMEDIVLSRVNYDRLDSSSNSTRIRLDSTAVDVRHVEGGTFVDVMYVKDGGTYRVRGKHVVLACYNAVIPHICPELPAAQAEAIAKAVKIPLVYINIAVRNWKAFESLGYHHLTVPRANILQSFGMDFPVSMGSYRYTQSPNRPAVLHGSYVPTVPDAGLDEREQHVEGRRRLLQLTFDDFEKDIAAVMSGALGPAGFDFERDVSAITVNRWPHGYAYEYNDLYDPPEWTRTNGPHLHGAAQMGRISIANSDASAYAFVDGAIDAADRAVSEQLAV